jgi:hypothetical protein
VQVCLAARVILYSSDDAFTIVTCVSWIPIAGVEAQDLLEALSEQLFEVILLVMA